MKKIARGLMVLAVWSCFCLTVFAGSINSAEQKILDTISGNYMYNGEIYKVTDAYIAQVSAYLSRDDVDLSESDANAYIDQFYANIGAGISSGYMEKVESNNNTGSGNAGGSGNNGSGSNAGNTQSGDSSAGSENTPSNGDTANTQAPAASSGDAANTQTPGTSNGNTGNGQATDSQTSTGKEGGSNTSVPDDVIVISSEAEEGVDNTLGSTVDGVQQYTVAALEAEEMYVWDIEELNVHEEAYKDSKLLGTLEKGSKVIVTGAATTGWAEIEYEGGKAYVSAVYLRTAGYMKGIGVLVEEPETEETAADEGISTEETSTEDTKAAKDYSDAAPFQDNINMGRIALIVVIAVVLVLGAIVLWHRSKHYK